MHANASEGAKVLPIARISIKKTGRLSTMAEARGNSSIGRQPPSRCRNQKSDGAYASEKTSAATISDVIVAVFMLAAALRSCAPVRENVDRSSRNPSNHEPREIEINFICVQNPNRTRIYFLPMPRWMMCCISSEFGIPSSVAGLRPNGPPSVFAMNVMLSPVA